MRILFVAFQDSIHTARWIRQLAGRGWDLHLFPSMLEGELHPSLKGTQVRSHYPRPIRLALRLMRRWAQSQRNERALHWFAADPLPLSVWWLARVIRMTSPDIVHSLEIQHAGYLTLEVRKRLGQRMPPWIVGNWGSDIHLFGRLPAHVDRIKEVLRVCDYYTCECQRDVRLAIQLGLRGKPLPVLPNAGGYDLDHLAPLRRPGKTSSRRVVLLKGHQNWAGRALVGLKAIELCAKELRGYKVVIPTGNPDVELAAELLSSTTGLDIEVMWQIPHEEMMKVLGRTRIFIGLSISDAISTSLLEAIVMGAFPIQSSTACVDEWLVDGTNGLVVSPEDPHLAAEALRRALADDSLVDRAAQYNLDLSQRRLQYKTIQLAAAAIYTGILEQSSRSRQPAGGRSESP